MLETLSRGTVIGQVVGGSRACVCERDWGEDMRQCGCAWRLLNVDVADSPLHLDSSKGKNKLPACLTPLNHNVTFVILMI